MKRNYTLKINGASIIKTHSIIRFLRKTRLIKWGNKPVEVFVRVYDGRYKDVFGKMIDFFNEGTYANKKDFDLALTAFLETREENQAT